MAETETLAEPEVNEAPIQDMEVEPQADETAADNGAAGSKRARDEGAVNGENNDEVLKKQKSDQSLEEEGLEKTAEEDEKKPGSEPEPETESESGPIDLGPKKFESSLQMFDYFYKFLYFWTPNVKVNKYEHVMLLELIKKGHLEPDKKIGKGIRAFQIRYHPKFKSRCFFLTREDDSEDDFSFRKCIDHIRPLPENMQIKHDGRGGKSGGDGRGGRGHGRGRWGGAKSRN